MGASPTRLAKAHLQHLPDRRFQPDFEEQNQRANPGQHVDRGIGPQIVEAGVPDQREIAQQHSDNQLAKNGRLAQAHGQLSSQLGNDQDNCQSQHDRGHRVVVRGAMRGEGHGWQQGQDQKDTRTPTMSEHDGIACDPARTGPTFEP
jgi:hypothetical protein